MHTQVRFIDTFLVFSSEYKKFAGFWQHIQLEHHFSNNVQVFTTSMVDFIRICSQNRICWLVTIQFWRNFVKSGVVIKLYTNAYASTVYGQIFSVLLSIQQICKIPTAYSVRASFFEQCSSIYNLNGGFFKDL